MAALKASPVSNMLLRQGQERLRLCRSFKLFMGFSRSHFSLQMLPNHTTLVGDTESAGLLLFGEGNWAQIWPKLVIFTDILSKG